MLNTANDLALPKLAKMRSSPLLPSSEVTKAAVRMATRSLDASDESTKAPSEVTILTSCDQDSDDNSTLSSMNSDSQTIYAGNLSPPPARRSRSSRSRRASKACLRQRSLVDDMDRINDEIASIDDQIAAFQTFIQVGQERHDNDNDNDDNTVHTIEVLDGEGASSACGFMDCVAAYQDPTEGGDRGSAGGEDKCTEAVIDLFDDDDEGPNEFSVETFASRERGGEAPDRRSYSSSSSGSERGR